MSGKRGMKQNRWEGGLKICPQCSSPKGEDGYYRCGDGRFMSWCKDCCRKLRPQNSGYFKDYYQKNRVYRSIRDRCRRYGVDEQWIEQTFLFQRGCCAICKVVIDREELGSWHIDHDHLTEVVRGILCCHCNRLLGAARDNIRTLEFAIDYLKEGL